MEHFTVRLTATHGTPLAEGKVRATVVATAHAIAERVGVLIAHIQTDERTIQVTLDCGEVESVGFLAELMRLTNAWYVGKFNAGPLWGPGPGKERDEGKDNEQDEEPDEQQGEDHTP